MIFVKQGNKIVLGDGETGDEHYIEHRETGERVKLNIIEERHVHLAKSYLCYRCGQYIQVYSYR